MQEQPTPTREDALARFNAACAKFEKYDELYDDSSFAPSEEPEKELEELKRDYSTPEAIAEYNAQLAGWSKKMFEDDVRDLENQILYNHVQNDADAIYGEILKCAKLIATDCASFGFDQEEFETKVFNMGVAKEDIDDEKSVNEALEGKAFYPVPKEVVSPITDEDELKKFLFGQ